MEFTNHLHVPLPVEETWSLLLDIPRVLPCLPGARLVDTVGDNKYLGSVSVKLGPIKLTFDGQAELVRKDDAQHIAWLRGSGLDPKGRGSAESEFSFALSEATGGGTDVAITTQLQLSGAVAQYGRGSGMIAEVASHILKQFERNLVASLQGGEDADPCNAPPAAAGMPAGSSNAAQGVPMAAALATSGDRTAVPPDLQALVFQAQAVLAQAQAVLAATQQSLHRAGRNPPPQELNMLGIGLKAAWSRVKHAVAGVFGRR